MPTVNQIEMHPMIYQEMEVECLKVAFLREKKVSSLSQRPTFGDHLFRWGKLKCQLLFHGPFLLNEFLFFSIGFTIITMRSFPWDTNRILGLNGEPLAIKENIYNDVMDIPALWEPKEFRLKCQVQLGFLRSFCLGVVSFFDVYPFRHHFNQISIGFLWRVSPSTFCNFFSRSVFLYWTSARKMASLFKPMAQCSLEPQQT